MEAAQKEQHRTNREGEATEESLLQLEKPALVERIRKLEIHVQQLQNLLQSKDKPQKARSGKPFDFTRFKRRHVALRLLYLGWDYNGYVLQEDTGRTVEAALFDALEHTRLLEDRATSHYHRCGRTDKGVSAFSQVISIDLRTNLTEGVGVFAQEGYQPSASEASQRKELDYVKIINGVLPPEIRVLAWAPVDQAFSARFDCRQRTYRYFFPRGNLDVERMWEGVPRSCEDDSHTTTFHKDGFAEDSYDLLCLEIVGQAFLWHQVRCIVAVLLLIGQRLEEPQVISELLDVAKNPCKPQYAIASELPLVLYDCQFEGLEWQQSSAEAEAVATHLQALWTQARIKSAVMESMLATLPDVRSQPRCLLARVARNHKPLLERPLCGSLEERMAAHAKRRKICTDDQEEMVE
ncbi:hypothetical protein MRX96_055504 [Rhipicephalus microplus]